MTLWLLIHGELRKLGIVISQASVSKYMVCHRGPPYGQPIQLSVAVETLWNT